MMNFTVGFWLLVCFAVHTTTTTMVRLFSLYTCRVRLVRNTRKDETFFFLLGSNNVPEVSYTAAQSYDLHSFFFSGNDYCCSLLDPV